MQLVTTYQTLDKNLSTKPIQSNQKELVSFNEKLKDYCIESFQLHEKLFSLIKAEQSYYTKPEPLRHPLIFYYGHTASFFINKFIDKGIIQQRVNPQYERMFSVGVDQMDWDDLNQSHYEWPSLKEAKQFRKKVKNIILNVIQNNSETSISWENNIWAILMGIEHERIHLETSAVIIRRLPIDQVQPLDWFQQCPHSIKELSKTPRNTMKIVEKFQKVWDRQRETTKTYGWDNQFGHKIIKTKQYSASQMLVSNGEYFEFFKDKGYSNLQFWSEEGRNWLKSTKVEKPLFWQIKSQNVQEQLYYLRTIVNIIEMPWDWPVEVNNLEAQAFCNWKSKKTGKNLRLPTEDEYFAMRSLLKADLSNWKPGSVGNINLEYWMSPNPVNMFQTKGFFDIIGNVWQHTVTPIYPFEGFQIHPLYQDYTTPTLDNRHNIIKGGSFMSTGSFAFYHCRNYFRRHFYQFAGFRYVESQNSIEVPFTSKDQSDKSVEKALKINFLDKDSYIEKVLQLIDQKIDKASIKKSLVVGCSVGRLPFQLSKQFDSSYGIDYTARYFQMAVKLKDQKLLKYRNLQVNLNDFGMSQEHYSKVHFYQMNPENTDPKKINQIDFLVIDEMNLRKNLEETVLRNCLKLCVNQNKLKILLISNSQSQPLVLTVLKEGKYQILQVSSQNFSYNQGLKRFQEVYQSLNRYRYMQNPAQEDCNMFCQLTEYQKSLQIIQQNRFNHNKKPTCSQTQTLKLIAICCRLSPTN